MAAKRKKEVQYEADSSQARVDDYFRKNPMTGNPFKDIGGLLATRDDRNRAVAARESLDTAADRDVAMRGQDFELDVRKGANEVARMGHQLSFDADMGRTAAYEKGQNQQFELGKGELDINRAVLGMQQDRYNNVTKPSDRFSMAERAAEARVGAVNSGFELSEDLFKETSKYLKEGKPAESSTATAAPKVALDPLTSSTNVQQFAGYEPYPDILEAAPITNYGKGILPQIGGSAVEGIKLLGRTAARITAKDPLSPSRRYKRKVNK